MASIDFANGSPWSIRLLERIQCGGFCRGLKTLTDCLEQLHALTFGHGANSVNEVASLLNKLM